MSTKYEFDDTRSAIGASQMSDEERGKMLKKFQKGGGHVLGEKALKSGGSSFLSKRRLAPHPSDLVRSTNLREGRPPPHDISASSKNKTRNKLRKEQKPREGFIDLFFFRLRCYLSGITNLAGKKVRSKFAVYITKDLKDGLSLIHRNLNHFFLGDQATIQKAVQKMDEMNPIYVEVLDHLYSLYDASDFQQIEEIVEEDPETDIQINRLITSIKSTYLRLYYILPWISTASKAVNLLYQFYVQNATEDKQLPRIKAKEMAKVIRNILSDSAKSYFLLICCDAKIVYEVSSKAFRDYIGFNQGDSPGKRAAGESCQLISVIRKKDQEEDEDTDGSEENSENEEEANPDPDEEEGGNPIVRTKEYKYGKALMDQFNPEKLRDKHDALKYYSLLSDLDKVLLSFLYFKEFDAEYSLLLTTKQIFYNIDLSYGVQKDYSKILPPIASTARNVEQVFEEYYSVYTDLKELEDNSGSNYINQTKREASLQSRINSQSNVVRQTISQYMQKVVSNFATLIASMREGKNIVVNMDDVLSFGGKLDKKKKLSGKKVKECITEAYCYSLALKYQIEEGLLYGLPVELKHTEAENMFKGFSELASTPAQDATPPDTPAQDATPPDTPAQDAMPPDVPAQDATPPDTPAQDATPSDTPAQDAAPPDTPAQDAAPGYSGSGCHAPGYSGSGCRAL